ncbi:hypothetical protein HK105_206935 [Polyrhizophydium stewartii]|uniref:Dipeptidase n=1 Tax=Polyrhizophydium stewartii TaxID=2732419 RepID=A0ABR4N1T8_9FUNG
MSSSRACLAALVAPLVVLLAALALLSDDIDLSPADWLADTADSALAAAERLGIAKPRSPLDRALRLLDRHPLADGHNDIADKITGLADGAIAHLDLTRLPPPYHTDITRLRQGRVGIQAWSAYIPCPSNFTQNAHAIRLTLDRIDLLKRIAAAYPDDFELVGSAAAARRAARAGKIASLIGIEGGHQIAESLTALRMYYDLGVRYMTLTHTCHTSWADSCAPPPLHHGLTPFGADIVREMNRIGMLVDISHVSHETMRDVVNVTRAPLFVSHSSAYGLCANPRNVPDDVLLAMKKHDGIIMINFWPELISCGPTATIAQVADHIEYISKLVGPKHVGFGADFDGLTELTTGLEDVSTYPKLVAELLRRGFSDADVVAITSGNFLRVLEKTEIVARKMAKRGAKPNETNTPPRDAC